MNWRIFSFGLALLLGVTTSPPLKAEVTVNFTKADYADWTLPENWDCLSPDVCLTRGDRGLLCNVPAGDVCDSIHWGGAENPTGTEWAEGTCSIADDFGPLMNLTWWGGGGMGAGNFFPGLDLCLRLTDADLYFEFQFTSWTCCGSGGGVSWTRTLAANPASMITTLVNEVLLLNLSGGIENSLDTKLDSAINALDDINSNNDVAAINSLQAFINAVEAQRGNKISEADADHLIALAQQIIDMLTG